MSNPRYLTRDSNTLHDLLYLVLVVIVVLKEAQNGAYAAWTKAMGRVADCRKISNGQDVDTEIDNSP